MMILYAMNEGEEDWTAQAAGRRDIVDLSLREGNKS
jgi:hypothetical protein